MHFELKVYSFRRVIDMGYLGETGEKKARFRFGPSKESKLTLSVPRRK
jgi:hypothetical protein